MVIVIVVPMRVTVNTVHVPQLNEVAFPPVVNNIFVAPGLMIVPPDGLLFATHVPPT